MTSDQGPLTIRDAAAAMRAAALTPIELLGQCLARIERYEPSVRAWVLIDRDGAREQAQRLTDELERGEVRGPLHGIPVGVKDIIDVVGLPTGCGSAMKAPGIAPRDAECVRRLRAAGAVIIGKTVTTAYAYLDPAVTRNPWDLSRTPGGSSSGSAAAVACGMCLAALGTQTVGSLTRPASYCGVCSYKPPKGRVSDDGVLPLAPTLDHVGVMARCVSDLATLANALADNSSLGADIGSGGPTLTMTGPAVERAEPEMRLVLEQVARDSPPVALPPEFAEIPRYLHSILAFEAASVHGERFARHANDFPPKIAALVVEGHKTSAADYAAALAHHLAAGAAADHFFREHAVLITPAALGPAPDRTTTGDGWFNAPWSYTGRPTVSLPVARTAGGLPLAAQLVGGSDVLGLLRVAAALECKLAFEIGLPPQ
jgi:aspartyl-tRNA(Asn)/glutamyl-tRNA(Gln) amidotransferase subunit A